MPEGHSIRIHADRQSSLLGGKKLTVTSPQRRFEGAAAVSGQALRDVEGIGKHLFYHFSNRRRETLVHVHLGRLGRFRYHEQPAPDPSPNCRMRLESTTHAVDLSGPTRCTVISADQRQSVLNRLGPDPLRADADPSKAWARIHASAKAIGALLLDQSIIAGLGNIFRAEILYLTRINPRKPGRDLTKSQFNQIWKQSVRLLKLAVACGWIITTTEEDIGTPIRKAKQKDRFYVYHRDICRRCGGPIKTLTIASRTLYWCPKEQTK